MSDTGYVLLAVLVMALVTCALRALPFVAGPWLRRHPLVQRLGSRLPLPIMVLLLLHAARGSAAPDADGLWREALAVAIVGLLQWRLRHTLLSIAAGTAAYILLRAL